MTEGSVESRAGRAGCAKLSALSDDIGEDEDVVLLHSPTEDGGGVRVVRARKSHQLEVGELRPVVEGKPLLGDVVRLHPREETPRVCDVEVLYSPETGKQASLAGPPQVANRAYLENWERIFGCPPSSTPS
jgi:hypothetical protein